jgi:uncharacterized membrane protein
MDLRLALYDLTARHDLDATRARRLREMAGLNAEPALLIHWLVRGTVVLGAALIGLGVVFWIAANWDSMSRLSRFALLQGLIVVMCAGAVLHPQVREGSGLIALLGTGALFAYFGQTYQTGADPWQLFALWAVLTLPLCLAARSDVIWAPWTLVAMAAISLWVHAQLGQRWWSRGDDLQIHVLGWLAALVLVGALSHPTRRFTGAGAWSMRTAVTLTVVLVTSTAIVGLVESSVSAHYWIGLLVLAVAAGVLANTRLFDIYGLSAVALGLNAVLVGGIARALFQNHKGSAIPELLLIGVLAAGLLAATVAAVLRILRHHAVEAE